jgi:peroxiredoxin
MRMELDGVIAKNVSAQPDWMLPVPAVFIADTRGRIRWEYVNPDYKERVHPDMLLTAAKVYAEKPKP